VESLEFVIAGYATVVAMLVAYTARLFMRAANAKRRAESIAARMPRRAT